jgi:hypothetical protein
MLLKLDSGHGLATTRRDGGSSRTRSRYTRRTRNAGADKPKAVGKPGDKGIRRGQTARLPRPSIRQCPRLGWGTREHEMATSSTVRATAEQIVLDLRKA